MLTQTMKTQLQSFRDLIDLIEAKPNDRIFQILIKNYQRLFLEVSNSRELSMKEKNYYLQYDDDIDKEIIIHSDDEQTTINKYLSDNDKLNEFINSDTSDYDSDNNSDKNTHHHFVFGDNNSDKNTTNDCIFSDDDSDNDSHKISIKNKENDIFQQLKNKQNYINQEKKREHIIKKIQERQEQIKLQKALEEKERLLREEEERKHFNEIVNNFNYKVFGIYNRNILLHKFGGDHLFKNEYY